MALLVPFSGRVFFEVTEPSRFAKGILRCGSRSPGYPPLVAGRCRSLASSRLPGRVRPQPKVPQRTLRQFVPENTRWDNTLLDRGPIPEQFYQRHQSTILRPQFSGRQAWSGLTGITGLNLAVLFLWNPDGFEDTQQSSSQQALQQGSKLVKTIEYETFMYQNFTTNITNTRERVWTLATACLSHQDLLHFVGNMFALWLFGFPTYRVIGTTAFCGLYLAGGVACSGTHVLHNCWQGRTGPPLSALEIRWISQNMDYGNNGDVPSRIQERLATCDRPSLGASGSVMALAAVAAVLFPLDKVKPNMMYGGLAIPLPSAVLLFVMSDLSGITQGDSAVDHVGHIGGLLMGILYVTMAWYSKAGSFRILHSHPTGGQLPLLYRIRQWQQGKNPWQRR